MKAPLIWHIITCEFPPQSGGVSDYAHLVANGLASLGDEVHVWCPERDQTAPQAGHVNVYATLGKFAPSDLRATGRALDRFPGPLRLLVQWVPHGYGYKSLNLPFCIWLSYRKWHHGDQVDLVVHEPFLPFKKGKWRQNAAAIMHRVMMMVLLRTADRVWLSTPAWEKMIRPFSLGRRHTYNWLPLPSNVPVVEDPAAAWAIHAKYSPKGFLIGHFGTFGSPITPILQAIVPPLLRRTEHASLILIGPRSSGFRDRLVQEHPDLAKRIHAVGPIDARDVRLSAHIRSCDLMIQPYPDGVTSRRTSVMAALAHARPTVSTSGPLTEPFWDSSGAVALAPAGDNEAFVESALRILGDPQHRSSLGEAAGKFYRREFDVERIIERLRAIDQGAEPGWAEPKGR